MAVALQEAGLAEQSDAIATIPPVADPESALHALGAIADVARSLPTGGPESPLDLIRRGVVLSAVCVGYALDGVVQGAAEVAREIRERMAAAGGWVRAVIGCAAAI